MIDLETLDKLNEHTVGQLKVRNVIKSKLDDISGKNLLWLFIIVMLCTCFNLGKRKFSINTSIIQGSAIHLYLPNLRIQKYFDTMQPLKVYELFGDLD